MGSLRRQIALSVPYGKGLNFMGMQGDALAVVQTYSPMAIHTVDLATGSTLRTFAGIADTSGASNLGEAATLSPSGKVIVVLGRRGTTGSSTSFVDLITGTEISSITSGANVFAISADDAQYVGRAYTASAPVTLVNLRSQQLQRILPFGSATDYPSGFSFSTDGSRLAGVTGGNSQGGAPGGGSKVRVYEVK